MTIIVEKITKNIVSILINRPAKRNALDLKTFNSLLGALRNFDHDDEAKVAIIGGVGGNFCAGYDLNEIIDRSNGMPNLTKIEQMLLPFKTRLLERKITIAAIDGCAAGFGYELALRCDFRIAERDSKMGFMNRRFGIPIINGGTVILPQLVGLPRAMDLIATGRAQPGSEAAEYGFIAFVADIGCSLGRAINFARSLVKFEYESMFLDLSSVLNHRENQKDNSTTTTTSLLQMERLKGLDFLNHCGPRECAVKFLDGQLCRHGSFELGNSRKPEAHVSL